MGRVVLWGLILAGAAVLLWYACELGNEAPPPYVRLVEGPPAATPAEAKPGLAVLGVAPQEIEGARPGNAHIRGVVVGADGKPQRGITVLASPLPPLSRGGAAQNRRHAERLFAPPVALAPAAARATTDALGAFRLEGLETGRRYRVQADVDAPLVSSSQDWSAAVQQSWIVRLVLERGSPLKVRVVDADGKGIQAWVTANKWDNALARAWIQAPWTLPDTQTGPDGRLAISAVPDQPLLFHVRVPGRGSRTNLLVQAPTDKEVELRFEDASGARVEGRVTSTTGEAVVGAKISVATYPVPTPQHASYTTRTAVTGPDGTYKVERLPPGLVQALYVIAEGYIVPPALAAGTPVRPEKATRIDVVLAKGGTISGRVLDGAGAPLADVEVQATRSGNGYGGWMQPLAETVSGADGTYILEDVALGAGVLYGRLPGHFQPKMDEGASSPYPWMRVQPGVAYEIESEGAALEKDVILKKGTPVTGHVVGPEGEAVPGVTLTINPAQGGYSYSFSRPGGITATSDEEGAFLFEGLEPGQSYNINGRSETLLAKQEKITIPETGSPPDVEITMQAGGSISGLVLQDDGTPAAGASVYCNGHTSTVLADGDGLFEFVGVKEGTWQVQVWGMNPLPPAARTSVKVTAGEPVEDVELTLPATLSIRGTVVDEAGKPMAGMTVTAGLVRTNNRGPQYQGNAASGPDGSFEIRGLIEGEYHVGGGNLSGGGKYRAGSDNVQLEYRPPQMEDVEGRVLDADGHLVARGAVQLWSGAAGKRNRQYNAAITGGRFYVRMDLSVDTAIDAQVSAAFDAGGRPIDFLVKRMKDLEGSAPLEIKLERGLVVSGRVVNSAGAGVAGVQVRIAKKGTNNYAWNGKTVSKTSEDGSWRFGGLQEGEFTVSVTPGGDWMNPDITPVEAGDKDVVIKLARGLSISGIVYDPDGEVLAGADVYANETQASRKRRGVDKAPQDWTAQYRFRTKSGADGRWTIRGLAEDGFFSVGAGGSGPEGQYVAETIQDVAPGAKDLAIRLGEAASIEGSIWGPNGEPVPSGSVRVSPAVKGEGLSTHNVSLRGGSNTFRITPLKAGRYKLSFHPRDQRYSAPPPVEIDAPSRGVRIELIEALLIEGRLEGDNVQGFNVAFVSKGSSSGVGVSRDGTFKIKANAGAVGSLFARRNGDTRYAWLEGVEPGLGETYSLQLREGLTITGQIEGLPYGFQNCNVYARIHNTWIHGKVDSDGRFRVTGLPPGDYTVQAWLNGGKIDPVKGIEAGANGVILQYQKN